MVDGTLFHAGCPAGSSKVRAIDGTSFSVAAVAAASERSP
jgi:hypothetical protein